ncbi:CopD family protein [Streptomyces sp. S1D4-11]
MPLTAAVVTEGLRAHPQTYAPGWGALVIMVHLTAVALWSGALVYVVRCAVAWRSTPGTGRSVVGAYARQAAWLFAAVVASGAISGLVVLPLVKVFSTGYGQLLVAKLAVVAVVAGIALAARQRLRRDAAPTRSMRWEAGLLVGVLGLTAALTAAAPPRSTNAALSIPPPPSGPVVPVGARAGLLGISVAASSGQVVVQLTAPNADAKGADAGYRLSLTLADPAERERELTVRGCGVGCFVAPVSWQRGTSHLTLHADSKEWRGGQASVAVPWPAHSGPQALVRAVETLKQVGHFTLYERVTSDPSLGMGTPRSFPLTGKEFLERAEDPYRTGQAAVVDRVPGEKGTSTLLLAYPGEKIQVEMVLDAEGRMARQTVSTPTTLVTRTFVYPEEGEEE